jgi:2',3'-cyclic-nucleotide 2'-phosphodiesterase (5'-nucleotidase family)
MKTARCAYLFALSIILVAVLGPITFGNNGLHMQSVTRSPLFVSDEGLLLAQQAPSGKKAKNVRAIKVTLLSFNDLHGNLQPIKIKKDDGTSVDAGGIAGITTLVKEIRAEIVREK